MHEGGYINYAVSQLSSFKRPAATVNERQVLTPRLGP